MVAMDQSPLWYRDILNRLSGEEEEGEEQDKRYYFGFINESQPQDIYQLTIEDITPCIVLLFDEDRVTFIPYKNNQFEYHLSNLQIKAIVERYTYLSQETRKALNQ